jgi:ketosteroid isomerase-like protein
MTKLCIALAVGLLLSHTQADTTLRREIEALNAAMVAAFKRDPGSVATHYTDLAALIGGGQRFQGRALVDEYWKGATSFTDWTLEVIDVGGPPHAPWQYGRSVLTSRSGRAIQTYFVGLLRRQPSGELKFDVDAFTRETGSAGEAEAAKVTDAWLRATERGDAQALEQIFDDQYVIVSSSARSKAQEIADLVPRPGTVLPYFRSEETRTRAFGNLAITTGTLQWRLSADGAEAQRHYSSIAVRRPDGWKILAQQVTPVAK